MFEVAEKFSHGEENWPNVHWRDEDIGGGEDIGGMRTFMGVRTLVG
jgi:hypothetical protein